MNNESISSCCGGGSLNKNFEYSCKQGAKTQSLKQTLCSNRFLSNYRYEEFPRFLKTQSNPMGIGDWAVGRQPEA